MSKTPHYGVSKTTICENVYIFEHMNLQQETERVTEMLKGKIVTKVMRHRAKEVCIEFTDGTRLFIDAQSDNLELSVTGGSEE